MRVMGVGGEVCGQGWRLLVRDEGSALETGGR